MPRHALDQYETPEHYVRPLLDLIGPLDGLTVYEPCVGQGHIARFLTGARHVCTNDLDPTCPATMHHDARSAEAWPTIHDPDDLIDWTITNPPFKDELAILQRALVSSRHV